MEWLSWVQLHLGLAITLFFTINALLAAFVVLLENREPEKSIAWLLALIFVPLIGFIFYLFFGRDWHKASYQQKRLQHALLTEHRETRKRLLHALGHCTPLERTVRLLDTTLSGREPTSGNNVRILTDAHEKYPRLKAALKRATHSIDMEYYIFRDDTSGREIIEILKERAAAGVRVRFLIDGMGSIGFGHKHFRHMRAAGIACHYFSPLITLFYFLKANYRDHRKIVVVDNAIAFTGGINIGDEYLGKGPRGHWRDTSIEISGPAAAQFTELFAENWKLTTGEPTEPPNNHTFQPTEPGSVVDVVGSTPSSGWNAIHLQYLTLIHHATHRIRIQTPYFIPDESLLAALLHAALRGVQVELMLPKKPDWPYLRWVAHTYVEDLLRAGVRVYEYDHGFLHTKAIITDDEVASFGTCNFDIRSLRLDFEINVFLSGKKEIHHLIEDFERDLTHCTELNYATFLERPLRQRLIESASRLISPLL